MREEEARSAYFARQHVLACKESSSEEEERGSPLKRWREAVRRYRFGLIAGLLLFAYGLLTNVTSGTMIRDEVWFLQVVHRVMTGDVLYRDVWFQVTPLGFYITTALAALFGAEILVVKAVMALCFALTCLLTYRIAQQVGLGQTSPLLLVMILLVYVPSWWPGAGVPYTPLAYAFLLGCFSSILSWRDSTQTGTPMGKRKAAGAVVMAGVSAGLCFATKHSIPIRNMR
jgi:4-amino-4-deoxy-L-arabinose transferase-like glycosyltransferase